LSDFRIVKSDYFFKSPSKTQTYLPKTLKVYMDSFFAVGSRRKSTAILYNWPLP